MPHCPRPHPVRSSCRCLWPSRSGPSARTSRADRTQLQVLRRGCGGGTTCRPCASEDRVRRWRSVLLPRRESPQALTQLRVAVDDVRPAVRGPGAGSLRSRSAAARGFRVVLDGAGQSRTYVNTQWSWSLPRPLPQRRAGSVAYRSPAAAEATGRRPGRAPRPCGGSRFRVFVGVASRPPGAVQHAVRTWLVEPGHAGGSPGTLD